MERIVFLDFDGVLNNMQYLRDMERRLAAEEDESRQASIERLHDPMLDPVRIERLNELVQSTGSQVVLHTSWTFPFSLAELNGMLRRRGASFQAIAVTPKQAPKQEDGQRRIADYIREWLRTCGSEVASYVVLDDGLSADLGDGSFVHVPNGLDPEHVERAREILTRAKVRGPGA